MRFLDGAVADVPALSSPDTKDTILRSVKSANAIRRTPITSRLMCDGAEAAPRASPRLAEVVTPMIAMLAQGIGHFKREEAEVVWIIPLAPGTRTIRMCSFDGRSGGQSRPPPNDDGGKVEARDSNCRKRQSQSPASWCPSRFASARFRGEPS